MNYNNKKESFISSLSLSVHVILVCLLGLVPGIVKGEDRVWEATLSDVQFKATHNSYQRLDLPSVQITQYNVWEIELDFGIPVNSSEFIVGHDGPEPKEDLTTLHDWMSDIIGAMQSVSHPLILKLEVKTKDRTGPLRKWHWKPINEWGNWQERLRDSFLDWIGEENWITPRRFMDEYDSIWPPVRQLEGKFIITLQDNNDNNDIDTETEWFFISEIPGLVAGWADDHPIHNSTEFGRAVKSGANRITMDDEYREAWSNVFMHPPIPCAVCSTYTGAQLGTELNPYRSIAQALSAHWTYSGLPLFGQAVELSGDCPALNPDHSRLRILIQPDTDSFERGKTLYRIAPCLRDVEHAETADTIWYQIKGDLGETEEILFGPPGINPARAAFGISWCETDDLGGLESISVRIAGDDDIAIDKIIITSSLPARYIAKDVGWIGKDHDNPVTISLSKSYP